MSLFLADLRALGNLPTTAQGRRITIGMMIGLGLLSLMSWWLANAIVSDQRLLRLLGELNGEATLPRLLGYGLMTCPMVATWLGLATAQKQLFETSELMLWRQAPIASFTGPLQIFVRAMFLSTIWSAALAAPFVVAVMQRSPAPWSAYALIPVAIITCTVPLLATLLAVQILMVRFLAGRWLRLILSIIAALASVAFTIWLLLNLFTTGRDRIEEVVAAAGIAERMPMTVNAAATMLAHACNRTLTVEHFLPVMSWLAGALLLFGIGASVHARAHERYIESDRPMWRRSNQLWPTSLASNVRKKEFAQVLQQPGALIGFLLFAVLVFVLAKERVLVGNILSHNRIAHEARDIAALLTWWFLAVLLVLYAHMGRLALWDGTQWPLYMASPAKPGWILRGKLQAIATFLMWPLLLVAVAGTQALDVDVYSMLWFLGLALTGTLVALGVVAMVGTWPRLMRPDAEGQILQGGKSFIAAMIMVTMFQCALMPAFYLWLQLTNYVRRNRVTSYQVEEWLPWILGAAVLYGLLVATFGFWVGGRNYRRLLAPR